MAADVAGFLGSGGGGPNPLDQAMGTPPPKSYGAEPDADDSSGDGEVDPEFKDTAAELFPDWPDEDFAKLQKLIDSRVSASGMGG